MKRNTIFMAAVLIATAAFAQTPEEAVRFLENPEGVGVKAAAMGGAVTASANDYSALYYNPAGLTLLQHSELAGEMHHLRFENESTYMGSTTLENDRFNKLTSVGMAYRFPTSRGSLVMAFGYDRFKHFDDFSYFSGFSSENNGLGFELEDLDGSEYYYPYESDVLRTEDVREFGHLGAWSFGGGIALSPGFSLGVTFSRITGYSEYDYRFYQDDVDNLYYQYPANYDSYELYQFLRSEYRGWQTRVGGLFTLNRNLRLGLSVDLPSSLRVLENYSAEDVIYFDDDTESSWDLGSGEWEYLVRYPTKVSGGVAFDTRFLMLAASGEYRDWTQTRFDVPSGYEYEFNDDYDDLLFENIGFKDQFRPVLSWSAGGELRVPGTGLRLRGGYRVVPSPLYGADETLDKTYLSAGIGYELDRNTVLNATYIQGDWDRITSDINTPEGTTEHIRTQRIMMGITYRMNAY
ncbi:hypothetical protein JXO52_14870 [bacterium]|nr:hypothetical protein [bacterium]